MFGHRFFLNCRFLFSVSETRGCAQYVGSSTGMDVFSSFMHPSKDRGASASAVSFAAHTFFRFTTCAGVSNRSLCFTLHSVSLVCEDPTVPFSLSQSCIAIRRITLSLKAHAHSKHLCWRRVAIMFHAFARVGGCESHGDAVYVEGKLLDRDATLSEQCTWALVVLEVLVVPRVTLVVSLSVFCWMLFLLHCDPAPARQRNTGHRASSLFVCVSHLASSCPWPLHHARQMLGCLILCVETNMPK